MFILDKILPYIFVYIRPFIKWFLHTFTRLSELQRICYGARSGASRTRQVERSLYLSKKPEIRHLLRELDEAAEYCSQEELMQFPIKAVAVVQRVKRIKPRIHPDFAGLFGSCVLHIWSYKHLMHEVERLRAEMYDSDNLEHEQKLLELWKRLMPDEELTGRITKQWQDIGFQGDDPKTDFRGMGMLGLENLLFFAREYKEAAHHVLLHSRHPKLGYTFAIVGINLTAMAYRLLKNGDAKTHFYNLAQAIKQPCSLRHFHKLYCYLLFEFDRFWLESEPTNIMDFREIYQNFEITIIEALQRDTTIFKTNLVVENV
ncbi:ELMO domain-containing protein 2 [Musca vetustissima]|uniref:ELMO domain-containing protein 2 n=1 Tax=Musca vetustissima TaxID=27455 RepID=UPI002AB78524|nr:ELMO domain-containing protein 2 [Musca vetustissima]